MSARDPLSVAMVTSEVVANRRVDGAVVVDLTIESVRHITALWRNGRSVVAFVERNTTECRRLIHLQTCACKNTAVAPKDINL